MARMARDLHDGPLQDVFVTRLRLDALAHRVSPDVAAEIRQLSMLQGRIIRRMRAVGRGDFLDDGRRIVEILADAISDASLGLGFEPRCSIDPRVDRIDDPALANDLVHTVRESLSNVARHARATSVDLSLSIGSGIVQLFVRDNGVGMTPEGHRGNGLANLRNRAERNGGSCILREVKTGGTIVDWRVPLTFSGGGTPQAQDRGSFANSPRGAMA